MFRRFIWFLTLVVLGGAAVTCTDQDAEKGQLEQKVESESNSLAASYGYTVVEDVAPTLKSVSDLELVTFLNQEDDGRVNGTVMRSRAITLKANLGLSDAKYLLDHQSEILTEFRGNYLVFTGTLLRGSYGAACMWLFCTGTATAGTCASAGWSTSSATTFVSCAASRRRSVPRFLGTFNQVS